MLFRQDILGYSAEGRVTLALRRWRRAPPAEGSTVRTPVGVLALDRVTVVDEGDITKLGLTESLEVGYRLSPRGRAVLERLVSDARRQPSASAQAQHARATQGRESPRLRTSTRSLVNCGTSSSRSSLDSHDGSRRS